MSPSKTTFVLAFICMAFVIGSTVASAARPCPIAYKCDMVEKVVWATDDFSCFTLRNKCHLMNENCHRLNRGAKVLREVTRQECQLRCRDVCLAVYQPVCAEYNGVKRTFGNPCSLDNHICRTGETYSIARDGACDANPEI